MTRDLEKAIRHIKTRADAWAVNEIAHALEQDKKCCWCKHADLGDGACKECKNKSLWNVDYKQEPCDDAISREDALEALNTINGTAELDRAFEVIEKLPSVTSIEVIHRDRTVQDFVDKCRECGRIRKGHWIPVNERLPEEYGEYMITWVSDYTNKPLISIAEYEITDDFDRKNCRFLGEWLFDEYMSAYTNIKVIAWMPLPEPYKADMRGAE